MSHEAKVSAVIPVYNGAAFVGRAIESALRQTHPLTDIIVVDDGSADDSAEVASRYPQPVQVIRQKNGGPAAARNQAARVARGEWLAFLDADDYWFPEKTQRQLAAVAGTAAAAVHSFIDPRRCGKPVEAVTFERLWRRNCIVTSTMMVRRDVFERLGGFDESRALISTEDYNLWLRIAAAGEQILTLPEHLCVYEPGPDNLSSQLERFLRAELFNVERITATLHLPAAVAARRRKFLYEIYGRELLSIGQPSTAKTVFWRGFRQETSLRLLAGAVATTFPTAVRRRAAKWLSLTFAK